jgi:hypothetical protein
LDGEKSERAEALYASRAGYVGSLTRIRREIEADKMSNGKLYDIEKKLESYDNGWNKFWVCGADNCCAKLCVSSKTKYICSPTQTGTNSSPREYIFIALDFNPSGIVLSTTIIQSSDMGYYVESLHVQCRFTPLNSNHGAQVSGKIDTNIEIVKALKHVVATPKIEYMHFDGNPIKFPSFMHNFETCLERNNDSDGSKLQLLIQHCHGKAKAKEAIETCVNLPADEGYCVAKKTLTENFGKPHIIARAHIKKLVNLPNIKKADGPSLLEFARHLESTNRTLKGMGPEYVSDLDHVNTLKELNRKLPMFMKARWTEKAGKIYEGNSTPRFEDFLNFIKKKATLMNNEFGDDLTSSDSKDRAKEKWRNNEKGGRFNKENIALMVGMKRDENGKLNSRVSRRNCSMCSGLHGIWQCEKFRLLSLTERKKVVTEKSLCFKCLAVGHYARMCLKKHF